jgi:hypothetical protein
MDSNERKRVKVYELKSNDWFDRGTGFCTGQLVDVSSFIVAFNPTFAMASRAKTRPTLTTRTGQSLTRYDALGRGSNSCSVGGGARSHTARNQNLKGRWLPEAARYHESPLWSRGRILISLQIHSLCGPSPMSRTWRLVFKSRKAARRYGA